MLVPAYRIAMAVSEGTIARAWLDLLPWLALAAVIALPFAVGSAIVIARNITRPLSKLTVAADQMAQGTFDIDVPTDRHDEVGQLSRAFSAMATNVGETHMQMRALVANVSHDMRTPLTSILGFAQALRGGVIKGEAESKHAGDVIYDEVAKLSERLNDLLFLSEIEAGQALLQREEVDLSELVASAVERIRSVDDRGITRHLRPAARRLASRRPGRSWSASSRTCSTTPASSRPQAATSRCALSRTAPTAPASRWRTQRRILSPRSFPSCSSASTAAMPLARGERPGAASDCRSRAIWLSCTAARWTRIWRTG